VTLESTSRYWRIWFFVLEACGLAVQLVNASQAKSLPGRPETDKADAMWLARLTEMGLLRASFVPSKAIRDLRDYTRMRARLTQERTRCWQRLEKLHEGALVKLSSVAEIPGVSQNLARAIIAETGPDTSRFPTAGHLVSWAGLCPSARQPGTRTRAGKKGKGNTWLRASLGQAATGAARTATFPGERYHRIARRRGKTKAQVAVARSILVIIWHLLSDPAARFTDLGYGYYQDRTDKDRKIRNHIRQIEALGFTVTLTKEA